MDELDKTLQRNKIAQFILRIDLTKDEPVDFRQLVERIKDEYGQVRSELHFNYNLDMEKVEVNREEFVTYRLGPIEQVLLEINVFEQSIILNSSQYINNSVYKNRLQKIMDTLEAIAPNVKAKRIGMRYINKIPCAKQSDISKCLNKAEATAIKEALTRNDISRAMIVHEFQKGDYQARVQCGIPNNFFPSKISVYDLLLDIDVYSTGIQSLEMWNDAVKTYNHGAYDIFVSYIKQNKLEEWK